jgi:pimeloyl-ACP methyl ester carboxylesterase
VITVAGTGPHAHPSSSPAEFQPFRIAGGLAVYRLGRGEPVLLMPAPHRFERVGLAEFDSLADGLIQLGRQVITYDPPGSGRSAGPAQVSVDEVLECTDRALDACGLAQPVDAVGHSMAGLALLAYTLQQPHRIRRLVLIGTGSGGPAYMRAPGALVPVPLLQARAVFIFSTKLSPVCQSQLSSSVSTPAWSSCQAIHSAHARSRPA